jgi:hypothetical protein
MLFMFHAQRKALPSRLAALAHTCRVCCARTRNFKLEHCFERNEDAANAAVCNQLKTSNAQVKDLQAALQAATQAHECTINH